MIHCYQFFLYFFIILHFPCMSKELNNILGVGKGMANTQMASYLTHIALGKIILSYHSSFREKVECFLLFCY